MRNRKAPNAVLQRRAIPINLRFQFTTNAASQPSPLQALVRATTILNSLGSAADEICLRLGAMKFLINGSFKLLFSLSRISRYFSGTLHSSRLAQVNCRTLSGQASRMVYGCGGTAIEAGALNSASSSRPLVIS